MKFTILIFLSIPYNYLNRYRKNMTKKYPFMLQTARKLGDLTQPVY